MSTFHSKLNIYHKSITNKHIILIRIYENEYAFRYHIEKSYETLKNALHETRL